MELLLHEFTCDIDKIYIRKHNEYLKFFETITDVLISDLIGKRKDLKERLERINKYFNNPLVKTLTTEERLYLYESKRVFDIYYINTNPAHALFLNTKFKTKYICDKPLL